MQTLKKVPQDVVHSFKTVMEESGANTGFIVSKLGFQSGARKAVRYTNIHLLTFEELQRRYGKEWFRKQKERLRKLVDQLREAHRLHFDQFNALPIHNNMFFHTDHLYERLTYFHKLNIDVTLLSSGGSPKSYLGPIPIAGANPFDPGAEEPYRFQTVRQYFQDMTRAAELWIGGFEALDKEAHASFDALPNEEQGKIMVNSMGRSTEEIPMRVLKTHLSNEEYRKIRETLQDSLVRRRP